MTPNQRIFADEYLKDRNATRAYLAAYRNVKNEDVARKAGSRLLTNVDILEYIQLRLDELSSATIADAKEIMEYYTAVMRGEIVERVPLFIERGVQELTENSPRISDRTAAAEKLAKLIGADSALDMADVPQIVEVRPDAG